MWLITMVIISPFQDRVVPTPSNLWPKLMARKAICSQKIEAPVLPLQCLGVKVDDHYKGFKKKNIYI